MNPFRSGLGKVVLVAGACSGLVLGAVHVAGAAARPIVRSGMIPFTSASVDVNRPTSSRISWTAPGAHVVFVPKNGSGAGWASRPTTTCGRLVSSGWCRM